MPNPISEKQLAANRANAKKATGPKTEKGKSISRCNARRDGITGQLITLPEEDRVLFDQYKAKLIQSLNPQNPIEEKLAHDIAWDSWRLNHLRAVETNLYTLGQIEQAAADHQALANARTFRAESKRLDRMSLYEQRINRTIQRNLATLRDLQAERKRNYEADKKEEVLIARIREYNQLPIVATTHPSRNGFVFSNEEIAIAAVRERLVDTANAVRKHTPPADYLGNMYHSFGDSFFNPPPDKPRTEAEKQKHANTPPETLAVERLHNPAAFNVTQYVPQSSGNMRH